MQKSIYRSIITLLGFPFGQFPANGGNVAKRQKGRVRRVSVVASDSETDEEYFNNMQILDEASPLGEAVNGFMPLTDEDYFNNMYDNGYYK